MKKYTDLNDIKSYINKNTYLDSGTTARIYKYGDYIIKLFKNKGLDKERYEYLININNNTFLFPKSLIIYNNRIIGYIRNYVDGICLANISYNSSLNEILSGIDNIDYDTFNISENGIRILDLSDENIILDTNNNIKVIDIDEFGLCTNYKLDELSYLNLLSIRKQIFKYLFNTKIVKDIDNMNISTLKLIHNLINDYSSKYDVNIDNVTKLRYLSKCDKHILLR